MLNLLKSAVKKTPISPIAHRLYYAMGFTSQDTLYNEQTVEVMRRCLRRDSVCLDIGANMGEVLKDIVAIAPNAQHFAFEPIPALAARLRQLYPNVRVHEVALSNQQGKLEFQHFINMNGCSGLGQRQIDTSTLDFEPEVETIVVKTDLLDNIIPTNIKVDFIKIDIEGAEYLALCGGLKTILANRPMVVFEADPETMQLFDVSAEQVYTLLVNDCALQVSTMKCWLEGSPPLSCSDFSRLINLRLDRYFMAYPPQA